MSKTSVKLSAKWQLDAALLSRPVDLTPLVAMSRTHPDNFLEDKTLHRLVQLLNEANENKSNRDTKLDILNIFANVALSSRAVSEVRAALQGVSEWFDQYIAQEETIPGEEPELNKIMVLLLARCWDYKLKTEDVLELTQGNRKIALCTTVGLLEDGETYSTELRQKQKPGQGKMGQWEHELVCQRYEKPLMLQICRLLRGFTHPGTYFEASEQELALYSVERFADEMDTLLEITLRSNLVEKLSKALYKCLFEEEDEDEIDESKLDRYGQLEEYDHIAVASVHAFLQNLYFYSTERTEEFRRHLLMETLLIPRLILPYLDRCVIHATILNTRAEAYRDMLEGDMVAEMALHNPQLVKGMAASLRTLIIASFRAPTTQFVMTLLRRLNPTSQILRASAFCRYHDYIFALICMLNINMGALDVSRKDGSHEDAFALEMLQELAQVYYAMDREKQTRVVKRLMVSGALPLSRDTASYATMMSIVDGGFAGQFHYAEAKNAMATTMTPADIEDQEFVNSRAEAKRAHLERLSYLRRVDDQERAEAIAEVTGQSGGGGSGAAAEPKVSAFQIAVSVANASDSKAGGDSKPSGAETKASAAAAASAVNKFRLLGDLPSLGGGSGRADAGTLQQDAEVALNLELHKNKHQFMKNASSGGSAADAKEDARKFDPNIPKEFLCAINGHVMKDPVRSNRTGLVYERATIELWLSTRGAVCPITNEPLEKNELVADDDLRTRIKRYHIQQITMQKQASSSAQGTDDDLYDF